MLHAVPQGTPYSGWEPWGQHAAQRAWSPWACTTGNSLLGVGALGPGPGDHQVRCKAPCILPPSKEVGQPTG